MKHGGVDLSIVKLNVCHRVSPRYLDSLILKDMMPQSHGPQDAPIATEKLDHEETTEQVSAEILLEL